MARYTGPVCRLCRREGAKLYLKGERCYTGKCAVDRRTYAPGQHGQGRKKISEYGLQLREKQKARRVYGILEGQFRAYFAEADRQQGVTGENLLRLLETRLDNVVFRLGFARSRNEARQFVLHNHFTLNGKKVNIPSIQLRVGDVIQLKEKSKDTPLFKEIVDGLGQKTPPAWLELDVNTLSGRVIALPKREDIDTNLQEHLIVELYSR
ncbi:30S ribosomal protein s4 [Heliomicrobium modesticaldum Ice1]|uniref:Small ribosomal subunit protein uS4 n=1 Tax=Heliobacterium modesticaldum (strain ATCC 51547 / Ice1) TaxID=498761 RepID=RS4_HELMI|nr:30S ribosomal protein S4 [Heliomicrobium modesticaldum]B0TC84.1 RecName: Full=Small ribosomal subunit protein uS4; AltName: Full=30S ribosomal protein S4 [Heliomicrobium modesticaldum Ice1]ABZ83983.1 30S ribosomal protein s4 [Heliomicrobium modesticaldum Ice1]